MTDINPAAGQRPALALVLRRTAELLGNPTRQRRADEYDNTGGAAFRLAFEAARQLFGPAAVHSIERMIRKEYGSGELPHGQLQFFRGDRRYLVGYIEQWADEIEFDPVMRPTPIEEGQRREIDLYRHRLAELLAEATGLPPGDPDGSVHYLMEGVRSAIAAKDRELRELRESRDIARQELRKLRKAYETWQQRGMDAERELAEADR